MKELPPSCNLCICPQSSSQICLQRAGYPTADPLLRSIAQDSGAAALGSSLWNDNFEGITVLGSYLGIPPWARECLGSSEGEELEVKSNNLERIVISQQQKIFLVGNIQDLESSRPLCIWTLLFAGWHQTNYLIFLSLSFFIYKMRIIIVTFSELFGKEYCAAQPLAPKECAININYQNNSQAAQNTWFALHDYAHFQKLHKYIAYRMHSVLCSLRSNQAPCRNSCLFFLQS